MKQIRFLAVAFLCCLILFIPVMALSGASIAGSAMVQASGDCQVELTVSIHLDTTQENLKFPLPADAADVTLSGLPAQTKVDGDKRMVTLPALPAGQHTLLLRYSLPGVVTRDKDATMLTLPLLSGFTLPIDAMEFTVTLPGEITGQPVFISGYHQDNIRLDTTISGNCLIGRLTQGLKDHDTLRLELPVDDALFDAILAQNSLLSRWDWATLCLALLAMLYYCLTMLPKFTRHKRSFTAPEGITAGEVGTCLTSCGTDLNMMVLSWAQLGYIQIELTKRGQVLLHKWMDMGNERSYHEGRIFQILFSRRNVVDATAPSYVRLCRKVGSRSPLLKQLLRPFSGDVRIFRGLCCAAAICCGAQMGMGSVFVAVLMVPLCGVAAFCIQVGCRHIPLRNKLPLLLAIACGGIWIWLGVFSGNPVRVLLMVFFQFLTGVFAAYGGKRSELGQRVFSQLLGLRQHMVNTAAFDMQQLQQKNPNYFYELAPYALAMGVDRQFARRFDNKQPLPECGWLKDAPRMNATQWAGKLRQIIDILDKARLRKQS
ncbi:MAG: DUF2207 domain-containing protein [Oscillospiraceae bacterium]|nr:DUF2207 domain-containing protein [Oscillospiraceae bacterium]